MQTRARSGAGKELQGGVRHVGSRVVPHNNPHRENARRTRQNRDEQNERHPGEGKKKADQNGALA